MAIFKFYNIQLLPIDNKTVDQVGVDGYCKLFEQLGLQAKMARKNGDKLTSISISMRGGMHFAPFSITNRTYNEADEPFHLIHGFFLKFDDVNELFDTDTGASEYKSRGNTSSRRFEIEFIFDPENHIMAIQDKAGLPARAPLIGALEKILDRHAVLHFKQHSLVIEELTAADSLTEFFELPKQGYKSYDGNVTFSNSDRFDEEMEKDIKDSELELKTNNVQSWGTKYRSFSGSLMTDLPRVAKIQMALATLYGNATAKYKDKNGTEQKYQMQDYPVRAKLKKPFASNREKCLCVKELIAKAKEKTRISVKNLSANKQILKENQNKE